MKIRTSKGDKIITIDQPRKLLYVLRENDININAPCGGAGTCGKCRVVVKQNDTSEEVLACQTDAENDMEVIVAETGVFKVSLDGKRYISECLPDQNSHGFGIAIDIGTTTLVCKLCDLSSGNTLATFGMANPQTSFGADVISRISAVIDGHLDELESSVNNAIVTLIKEVCSAADISTASITSVAIAGNTVMEHLACGVDPTPIGASPYQPSTLFGDMRKLKAFSALKDNEHASECNNDSVNASEGKFATTEAYVAPCIAGYVGGDITCDMLALEMNNSTSPVLLVDLGTNGEMALSSESGILSCATAAGPVFEGARIAFGMPAYIGAISTVALEGETLAIHTIEDFPARGICGTGLIDTIALLLKLGIIDESGYMLNRSEVNDMESIPDDIKNRIGTYNDVTAFWVTPYIAVTQKDVRNLQLAKAAIAGGIHTIIEEAGFTFSDIEKLAIAGGFGQYLNLENAATIGLIPGDLLPVAECVGNTAIEGITCALINTCARENLEQIAKKCDYIELSTSHTFNEYYMDAMSFEE